MKNETTYSGILGLWQLLLAVLSVNTTDLPRLEESRQIPASQRMTILLRQGLRYEKRAELSLVPIRDRTGRKKPETPAPLPPSPTGTATSTE
ncbi:MAG: hypothetical protein ABUT39_10875 [Acidobacteriota bacterium]